MTFQAAVQWFEDWQLRLLVLASLFFQYFLFAAAVVRKLRVPHWFRALIWLAYQAGDVVAIYALATLFNQHKEEPLAKNPDNEHLDTLWAPVLLLHLGGQDGLTAYSIEDNENWRRYLLVAVCQITVAIYVFRTSWWSGDMILLRAAILLFVPGILKCLEKPWALKNATVTSIINSSDPRLEATLDEGDDDWAARKGTIVYSSQEEYVQAAADCVARLQSRQSQEELFVDEVADQPHHLFVDLGHPYSIRLRNLRLLVAPRDARADVHALLRSSLSKAFDRLYTKHKASFGSLLRAAVVLLTFVDIGLFQRSHRGVYDRADVVVTYVLLCCTAALEFVSACLVLGSGLPEPDDKLAQYNLVSYLARAERHPRFWAMARMLGASLPLDQLWCTAPPEPSLGVTRLVYDHVAGGWKDYIPKSLYEYDAATRGWKPTPADAVRAYRRFNDSRGQRTLEREGCVGRSAIEESLRMPFDASVLLWHLATEFCYFDHVDTGHDATRHSRVVSNYMAYLLFVQPEMLIPGARSKLFRATYRELRKMIRPPPEDEEAVEIEPTEKKASPPRAKNEMVRKVIQEVKSTMGLGSEGLVHKAWAIAHELMEFAEKKKWDFIEEQEKREDTRKNVMEVLRGAKDKVDEFIDAKDKKRDEVLNKLIEVMGSAQKKADEFISIKSNNNAEEAMERKTTFVKVMKETKDMVELFIKEERTKKQTKEDKIMELLQCAIDKTEELIKNEEEKLRAEVSSMTTDMEVKKEEKKEHMVKEFSENAGKLIQQAKEEKKKKLMDGRAEANKKAEEFIYEANMFINEEKKKNQTKEEEEITKLLESATKKADEFVRNKKEMAAEPSWKRKVAVEEDEKSVAAAKGFSKQAAEAIKLVDAEDKNLKDLMARNLIAGEEELRAMRGRERADDKMWAVIQGVWVEMLCFSAGRCRGYLHAKSLGNGGEYLSYVWLLLYYMGMETMPERMQRPEPPTVGDTGALVKTPTDEDEDTDEDDDDEQAQRIAAAPRRRRAMLGAPSAKPQPQAAGATSDAQTAPPLQQQQQQRLVAMPMAAISATAVVPVGDDIV